MTFRHEAFLTLAAVLAALGLAGCGSAESPKDVVLVTHDSFVVSKSVQKEFERETGLRWRILQSGDAGEALTKVLLTAGNPEGDVFFGVDNDLLSRALAGNVFDTYTPPQLGGVDPSAMNLIVSSVHDDRDVEQTVKAFDQAVEMLQAEGAV